MNSFAAIALPYIDLNESGKSWFASIDLFCVTMFAPIGKEVAVISSLSTLRFRHISYHWVLFLQEGQSLNGLVERKQ